MRTHIKHLKHYCACILTCFNHVQFYGLQPTRLLCPWDSPGKNTGVCCHTLRQGIFLTQGSNPHLSYLQYKPAGSLPLMPPGKPRILPAQSKYPTNTRYFLKFYLFIWNTLGLNSLLHMGFLQQRQVGASLCCSVQASLVVEHGLWALGFSSCGLQAQWLWLTGLASPWHVGSYWTRD